MKHEDGRVTILPAQFCRLAELFSKSSKAIEVKQYGSVLKFNDGLIKVTVNANGEDIHPPNQENPF